MDNSLKQRLLGATVLIALAIIFVPMFLSNPGPPSTSETANLQAPPVPDRRFQERTLSLDLPPSGATQPAPAAVDAPLVSDRLATVDTATAPRVEPEPVVDVAEAPAVAPAAAAEKAPPPAKPAATAASEPSAALPPGTAANGNFFVHLGDYGSTRNANELVATLKAAGHSAFTEPSQFGGKATTRVRIGPFADRASAETTRLRIASQPSIRAPATVVQNASDAKAAATPEVRGAATAGFAVQLGAFKTVDEANKLRDQARSAGFASFIDKVEREGQTLWRVRVGPSADRPGADAQRGKIRDRLKVDGVVVPHP